MSGHLPVGFVPGSTSEKCGYTGKPICEYYTPITWKSDNLTNIEVGWKTEWMNHRVQFNGAIYQEKWTDVQTSFFDPQQGLGNLTFNTNGPNYKVTGLELQVVARATAGLTLSGSGSYNKSEQTNSPFLNGNNPYDTAGFGKPITSIPNPYGAPGSRLAMSPKFEGNARARYEWVVRDHNAYWQLGVSHIGETLSSTGNVAPFVMPGNTTYDGSFGIGNDQWNVEVFGQNLSDENASTYTSAVQFVVTQTVLRPRVLGIRMSYKFSGK
jgi:outer membrane receptor protein involved in Fe transport